ncbi:MAG: transposase [Saprospiraceae bacterium]|nr:transposase [Saprospiraceae bacterium]
MACLKRQPFTLIIRIRANSRIRKLGKHKEILASTIFKCKHFKMLRKQRVIWEHQLFIAGQQMDDKEWLILVSDQSLSAGKQFYGERWEIEVFFAACKKRGFNFEDTHMVKLERIFNLMFLIAIAFIWAIKTGEWLASNGYKIPIKKLKKRKAKLFSIFKVGFDHLQERLLNFLTILDEIRLLSCT